jgi:DNA-binding transcriptional LysR family regulator
MRYDLTDLRLFVAVAEAKNLTRGAERAHLAPSSASHRIRALEDSIGAALLQREARGVSLTRAGEALLRHARQVFAQLEQMHADLSPYAQGCAATSACGPTPTPPTPSCRTTWPASCAAFRRSA